MGLCKCPKRKVTNQFCYEHRVNVCEYCMVTNHPQCIVQSYLQWLEDNDYNAICDLCKNPLGASSCIRLICYHVFHQHCLHEMGKRMANENEARDGGGFCCPTCGKNLFPPSNMVSPVADALKDVLIKANWARQVMGLPELQESGLKPGSSFSRPEPLGAISASDDLGDPGIHGGKTASGSSAGGTGGGGGGGGKQRFSAHSGVGDVGLTMSNDAQVFHADVSGGTSVRRLFDFDGASGDERSSLSSPSLLEDETVDKYKFRRPRFEWILKWWSDLIRPSPRQLRDPAFKRKRIATFVLLGLIALYLLVQFFSWLGRMPDDDDPLFDVRRNPFVRQEE